MIDGIVIALISGFSAIISSLITSRATAKENAEALKTAQAVTDTKIDELTREVREHNGFARRMPVIEEKCDNMNSRICALEKKGA